MSFAETTAALADNVPQAPAFDLGSWSSGQLDRIEQALMLWVRSDAPAGLGEAMRYAVLDGGKRLRPLLVLAAAQAVAAGEGAAVKTPGVAAAELQEAALRAACAVELIHAYSLVHDDMPCMDNDVLRRGKPTVHVKFGEAQALLVGDGLQALAFELITQSDLAAGESAASAPLVPAVVQARLCRLLARAAGAHGMVGGQAIDLGSVGKALSEEQLREMHRLKTGALLQASVTMGAACGESSATTQAALLQFGAVLGLAFQVVDDVLDVTADSATLGKTAGKDAEADKPTYVSLLGLEGAQHYARSLLDQAHASLAASGLRDTRALAALADLVVRRSY